MRVFSGTKKSDYQQPTLRYSRWWHEWQKYLSSLCSFYQVSLFCIVCIFPQDNMFVLCVCRCVYIISSRAALLLILTISIIWHQYYWYPYIVHGNHLVKYLSENIKGCMYVLFTAIRVDERIYIFVKHIFRSWLPLQYFHYTHISYFLPSVLIALKCIQNIVLNFYW